MHGKTLIFTTCYNERENIGRLLDEIVAAGPWADLLVVDDRSPDGTWDVLMEKKHEYPQLACVQRPRKLGIGSAHKYALFYAKAAIEGKTFKPGPTDHDSTIIEVRDGVLEDQLPAPLVTKDNVDDKALWGNQVG